MKRKLPLLSAEPTRRTFLELMATTIALATLDGCARPRGHALPFTHEHEVIKPGRFVEYSTVLSAAGFGVGAIARTREGRPIKIEGNPDHPASLGATTPEMQASIWELYDPLRARLVRGQGHSSSYQSFLEWMFVHIQGLKKAEGEGLYFLFEPNASPLLEDMRRRLLETYPKAKVYSWSPSSRHTGYQGAELAFGDAYETLYDFEAADVILSLDADFLGTEPSSVLHMHQFANRRVPEAKLNRLYIAECALSITGMNADNRLRLPSAEIQIAALRLLSLVLESRQETLPPGFSQLRSAVPSLPALPYDDWLRAVATDLSSSPERGIIIAGTRQPPIVHALACALNEALGNAGATIRYIPPQVSDIDTGPESLRALMEEIEAGRVRYLFIDAFDPVYSAPADLDVLAHLDKVSHVIYTSLFEDETAKVAEWFIPRSQELESWGDLRAQDGTVAIMQPLINPLFQGHSQQELLATFLGDDRKNSRELLESYWRDEFGDNFDASWGAALTRGLIANSAAQAESPTLNPGGLIAALRNWKKPAEAQGVAIEFILDNRVRDGRYARNPVMQELSDPVTKLTWDNAALLSARTAQDLDVETGSIVTIEHEGRTVEAPVYVMIGHADDVVSLPLGYGRDYPGRGFSAYKLRTSKAPWFGGGAQIRKKGRKKHEFAIPQMHDSMEGRPLALQMPIGEYQSGAPVIAELRDAVPSLYDTWSYTGHRWGLMVDLSRCTGCSACVVACAIENNTQVVGPKDIALGRDMHWLRIDRYFDGSDDAPQVSLQPVMCQHCEKAPCEYVCPVNATVHSDEGLNEMVYNRCVGTRYCSNNCPYKVRRYNWFEYQGIKTAVENMRGNPEVTLRARGVMEKCTYCVQRIQAARIAAGVEGRKIRDGEIQTACQQVCPATAIIFGDLNDAKARARALYDDSRRYDLLHELGTKPRTGYLVRIKNPNPELA